MSLFDDPSTIACPQCGATDPIEIVYGFPSSEMMDAATVGDIALGGCVIRDENPAYRCRTESCRHEFGEF